MMSELIAATGASCQTLLHSEDALGKVVEAQSAYLKQCASEHHFDTSQISLMTTAIDIEVAEQ